MIQEVLEESNHYSKLERKKRLLYLLRDKKVRLTSKDLFYFAKYVLNYTALQEQPHRELCRILRGPSLRNLIVQPRGTFKSTIVTIADNILDIVKNPNIRILIDSQDVSTSKKFLEEIRSQFESNDELRKLFGDYVGDTWNDSSIRVPRDPNLPNFHAKDPTILTGGVETPRVGSHVDKLVEDDLCSEHNTNNSEQLSKVVDHWRRNQPILEPGGKENVVMTPWSLGDLSYTIRDMEKALRKDGGKKFHIYWRGAVNSDGSLFFPERLSHEFLNEKRIELGSKIYSSQYACNALDEDRLLFKPSWIRFYGHYAPQNLYVTSTLDPAISERDDACNTACVTCGTDVDGYLYILDAWAKKADPSKILDDMFETQRKHNPVEFGVEVVAFQKTLKFWMWERARQTGEFIPFKELKTDTRVTKDMRIKALVPYLESGTILFPGTGPESLTGDMYRLYEELLQYPVGKTCDLVDALAYQLQLKNPARSLPKPKEPDDTLDAYIKQMERGMAKRDRSGIPIIGRRTLKRETYNVA